MRLFRRAIPFAVVAALCFLTACETDDPKPTVSALPVQASAPTITAPMAENKVDPPSPKVQAEPPKPVRDSAEALIAKVEKLYAAGQANYQAGHLEAARDNFDQAFNTMLSSNLDVRGDERLQEEFDKIVRAVHQLEMEAFRQGDGFSEPASEPAPIDEANDITFPVDPNIKATAEAEIKTTKSDLPLMLNDQVAMFINYFSHPKGRATLEHALARSGRYREMISRILREQGVPQDLIYLAQAESGFQPLAVSRAGARGMWQFIASAGTLYGLQRDWWVDDRQDPEKATRAAAAYLKDLYNQFGDWYLAMAAYNSGAGTVQHAVERTGYADFWELWRRGVLPAETRNYVPIIVAVTIMAKNPAQYGLEHVTPEPPHKADQVTIDYAVDLRLVAECVDSSVDELQQLNPSLLRMATPKDQSFVLKLPPGSAEKYQTTIAAIPLDMRTWWRYHSVSYGETLASIAHKYHTTPESISAANKLTQEEVKAGDKLIIPITPGRHDSGTVAYSRHPTHYKVRKGDTASSVAEDFEVPVEKLRKWNHLRGNALTVGKTLVIYKPAEAGAEVASSSEDSVTGHKKTTGAKTAARSGKSAENAAKYHKVRQGETLSSIAESYNTSVAALKKANPRLAANLRPGEILIIRK